MSNTLHKAPHRFNWHPDRPDIRDRYFKAPEHLTISVIPNWIDLRPKMSIVENQGTLGSCTANAIVGAIEYLDHRTDGKNENYSRLFVYYNERQMEGTIPDDAGAIIRDGIKSLTKQGICYEKSWPYEITAFAKKPPETAYKEAQKFKAVEYLRVNQNEQEIISALASLYPIVFGFSVYENFMSEEVAKTGLLKMPTTKMKNHGGHAVLIVGYDKIKRMFLVRNSWGTNWGIRGYFWMPFEYVTHSDLADDFWVIKKVTSVV